MLRNFVTDAMLKPYYPKLASYLWNTQTDYSTQISEAFNLVLDDLRARSIDVRLMGTELDLKRATTVTTAENVLTSTTELITTTGLHIKGITGFRRFIVNVTALTSTGYSIKLQGSNDQAITDSIEPTNWADIVTIVPIVVGESSSVFQSEYKYYRIVNTVTGSSITYTASLAETFIDRWVIWKTFTMIFTDFSKAENDLWDGRKKEAERIYESTIQSYKFIVDSNDDSLVDSKDVQESAQVTLSR